MKHDRYLSVATADDPAMSATQIEPLLTGLATGSRIATDQGWCPIEQINQGAKVMTMDHGFQPVVHLARRHVTRSDLMSVPRGRLGNQRRLFLAPTHHVLLPAALSAHLGLPEEMLLASELLTGQGGIARVRVVSAVLHHLFFENHQVIWSEGCPVESSPPNPALAATGLSARPARPRLSPEAWHRVRAPVDCKAVTGTWRLWLGRDQADTPVFAAE